MRASSLVRPIMLIGLFVLLLAACGGSDVAEPTVEEKLEKIVGEPLSASDLIDLLSTADDLCRLDEQLLRAVWSQLESEKMEFQEYVFTEHCPKRVDTFTAYTATSVVGSGGTTTSVTEPNFGVEGESSTTSSGNGLAPDSDTSESDSADIESPDTDSQGSISSEIADPESDGSTTDN